MDYWQLLELIISGCDNTDCSHCELELICEINGITPLYVSEYLSECENQLIEAEKNG